jgi:hypothetical protein
MIHYVVAFALLLHVLFWGAGGAMLAMPRPWRRFWPVLTFPMGVALQSAVVWAGAQAGLRGTQAYAWWSELIPLALLFAALRGRVLSERAMRLGTGGGPSSTDERSENAVTGVEASADVDRGRAHKVRRNQTWRDTLGAVAMDLGRYGVLWAAVGGCLALLVLPVAIASRGLTTISLGSCDAADYAAGARVLMEFAKTDREGFLGLTEVVRVHSVDNFFDYWIRLNHFTPSALMALNGVILHCAPHELATLMTAVLFAGTLPMVFWVGRAVIGYSGGVSVIISGLFGVSPVGWYAVAHVAPGQLVAAQAVSLLTWAGVTLWRGRLTWQRGRELSAVLAVGYWLVLGSYNFFLVVCLVPAVVYAGGLALWQRAWARFGRWVVMMMVPLIGCAVIFAGRVEGLMERFTLLQTYNFGWPVPALTAEGWLGMVQGPDLAAWNFLGIRWVLAAGVVGLLAWAFIRAARKGRRALWLVVAIALPVLTAYLWLEARGARLGTNASYDAYKLFAVFYPLLLPVFCWWVTLRRSRLLHEWLLVCAVAVVVIGFNVVACGMFIFRMSRPPLIVGGELRQLRKIEAMADVKSVNMIFNEADMWSRLWANAFLLRKEQFFLTDTYEGRWHTPLRGEWDLEGSLVALNLPGDGRRQITPRFALVKTGHPAFLRVDLGEGWHPEEYNPRTGERWQWTKRDATLRLQNPHDYPLTLECAIDGWSAEPRPVALVAADGKMGTPVVVQKERTISRFPPVTIPPGTSTLTLRSTTPATVVPGDPRPLGLSVFRFQVTPQR